jgi:hypothetical protein
VASSRERPSDLNLKVVLEELLPDEVQPLFLSNTSASVQDVALITDAESISSVVPHAIVVLSGTFEMGGWMVSAALRLAWERDACAVIIPDATFTGNVVALAQRLNISLLSTTQDPNRVAVKLAIRIGEARAGISQRLMRFAWKLKSASRLQVAIAIISAELGDCHVAVFSGNHLILETASSPSGGSGIESPLRTSDVPAKLRIVASVEGKIADFAAKILALSVTKLDELLLLGELNGIKNSIPTLALVELAGTFNQNELAGDKLAQRGKDLGLDLSAGFFALAMRESNRDGAAGRLPIVIRQVWNHAIKGVPLAEVPGGWLAILPAKDELTRSHIVARLRARLTGPLDRLAVGVGLSRHSFPGRSLNDLVEEAWVAASVARDEGRPPFLPFEAIEPHLVSSMIDRNLAIRISTILFPRLLGALDAHELVKAVLVFLDCLGSVTLAAESLGVHRNTLQARLKRARELGVNLDEPNHVLAIHIALHGLASANELHPTHQNDNNDNKENHESESESESVQQP